MKMRGLRVKGNLLIRYVMVEKAQDFRSELAVLSFESFVTVGS